MRERGSIVYDFDGTWTDSHKEMRPVLALLPGYFKEKFSIEQGVAEAIWWRMKNDITCNHEEFGIKKHPDGKIITAPLSSSIFELHVHVLAHFLDYFAHSEEVTPLSRSKFQGMLRGIIDPCGSFRWGVGGSVSLEYIARTILNSLSEGIPFASKTVFRPGLEDNIRFALDGGFDVAVVSNSPREVVEAKIQTRQSLCDLVRRIGHDRIIGGARKDYIYPNWDGRGLNPSHATREFGSVPERVRIRCHGLSRPMYMRRQSFADHLERLGFMRAFPRVAVGDCAENDLFLPHILYAEVGLIDHAHLPLHERRWAESEIGARVIRSFEDVSAMLSAAA